MRQTLKVAILLAALTIAGAFSNSASAAVVCTNSNPAVSWLPAASVRTCADAARVPPTSPSHTAIFKSTLESLGTDGSDAAQRLKEAVFVENDVITITITDTNLPGGSVTLSHTVTGTDSPGTIAEDFATQINDTLQPDFQANVFNATTLRVYSNTANATTYSTANHNPTNTGPATESVVLDDISVICPRFCGQRISGKSLYATF